MMQKIMVIGCPGSGKSTFSRALHQKTGLPLCHLDMLYWNSDKTTVEKSVFLARLCDVLQKESWIIDGNYSSTLEMRFEACDTVIFLDLPTEACLDGVRARRGKPRADMPWIETEEDAAFTAYIKGYQEQQRPYVLSLIEKYKDRRIIVFDSHEQADAFLSKL